MRQYIQNEDKQLFRQLFCITLFVSRSLFCHSDIALIRGLTCLKFLYFSNQMYDFGKFCVQKLQRGNHFFCECRFRCFLILVHNCPLICHICGFTILVLNSVHYFTFIHFNYNTSLPVLKLVCRLL